MWCGVIDAMLIGPVVLDGRMTGQNYLDFLQYGLPKQLEDVPLVIRIAMYYQHDGAPTHYPLSYGVPVQERYGSTLLPATREQHDQNCTQSH